MLNFHGVEPDPTLFHVPADYKIVDETDRFSIEIYDLYGSVLKKMNGTPCRRPAASWLP